MASTLAEVAALTPAWTDAWDSLATDLKRALTSAGLDRPMLWAGIRGDKRVTGLLGALGLLDGADSDDRVEQCLALQAAARPAGEDWTRGIASLSDLQVSVDLDKRARKRSSEVAELLDSKAKPVRVFSKPAEWKGKAYHRAEMAGEEHARKNAESVARDCWRPRS